MARILQLKITLKEITPQIWRCALVDELMSFHTLHRVIQRIMGWEDCHLYEFDVSDTKFGLIDDDALDASPGLINAKTKKLFDYIHTEKQKFSYLYDFGDSWEHEIVVENVFEHVPEEAHQIPLCLDGKRACPPEDCGGTGGYERYLDILKTRRNSSDSDVEELKEWWGDWEPEEFDIQKVNLALERL